MVDEASVVRFLLGIDDQPVPAVQRQHVEVLGLRLVCLAQSLPTHLHIQDLSDILHNEISLPDVAGRPQAPPPAPRVEGGGVGVLEAPHLLVVAEETHGAGLGVALHVDGPIDTD